MSYLATLIKFRYFYVKKNRSETKFLMCKTLFMLDTSEHGLGKYGFETLHLTLKLDVFH